MRAVKPEAYMAYMARVYDSQESFSDEATWEKSRAQVRMPFFWPCAVQSTPIPNAPESPPPPLLMHACPRGSAPPSRACEPDTSLSSNPQTNPNPITNRTPNTTQINAELVKLATEVGVDADALNARLAIAKGGNSGNATTQAGRSVSCMCVGVE